MRADMNAALGNQVSKLIIFHREKQKILWKIQSMTNGYKEDCL